MPVELRRRNLAHWIQGDPWNVTFYAPGRTPDDAETSFSATGRVSPAGSRGMALQYLPNGPLLGEDDVARYLSVLVVPWDTDTIKPGMRVVAEHVESGVTVEYTVAFARHVPHKWEVMLDERQ